MASNGRNEINRLIQPKSMGGILKATFKKMVSHEFQNYKQITELDGPIDDETISEEADAKEKLTKCSHSLPLQTIERMSVDLDYLKCIIKDTKESLLLLSKLTSSKEIKFEFSKKMQLFIDLDETLIYTYSQDKGKINSNDITFDGMRYLSKRPLLSKFLKNVSNFYDIIVFVYSDILKRNAHVCAGYS